MGMPKSVIRLNKNGVVYTSEVDKANYSIRELTRAALRDVGKYVSRQCNMKAQKLPGLRRSKRVRGSKSAFQYWARAKSCDLQVGIKHDTWYGTQQELGTRGQPKRDILRSSVYDNIPTIVEIESKYLSALESDAAALALIDSEGDYQGGADD